MNAVPLLEEVLHFIPKIRIGRKLHKLLRTDFIIKRLHLLTLAATNAPKFFEKLTSVTIASLHEPLVPGVMDETDDGVESGFAHVLPNRFRDAVRTSRQIKEFSIADRRAAVQHETIAGTPMRARDFARGSARFEEEEADIVGLTGESVR